MFLIHGENRARTALKQSIMTRTAQRITGDRVVENVELPEPFSGWFDLLKNDWAFEHHTSVDRADIQVLALLAEVRRLGEQSPSSVDMLQKGSRQLRFSPNWRPLKCSSRGSVSQVDGHALAIGVWS